MNAGKKVNPSSLIVILVASALISALTLAQAPDQARTPQAEQIKNPPAADPTPKPGIDHVIDHGRDKNGDENADEVVIETTASLVELVEFYSRKYFKFALDYLFELLDSLGIFSPDDLALNLNPVERYAAQIA